MKTLLAILLFPCLLSAQWVRTSDGPKRLGTAQIQGDSVIVTASAEVDSSIFATRNWVTSQQSGGTPRFSLIAQWDVSSTKTNIGTSFVNIYTQTNSDGKSISIDTNGKDSVKLTVNWNKVGSGTQTVEIHDGSNVLISMNVVSGLNTSTVIIPAAFTDRVATVRIRAKSTTAADDPIFEGAGVYVK